MARRGRIKALERLKVWVRAGGRCVFCNEFLLQSELTLRPVPLGEVAHNAAASDEGPRGMPKMSARERNAAENLLLLCGSHHPDADKREQLDLLNREQLARLKEEHERRILEATSAARRPPTVLLRMQGHVRNATVDLGVETATEAVLRSSNRFPELAMSFDRRSVEIDLRQIAGESAAGPDYYRSAAPRIDEVIGQRLRPAVEKGVVPHLSVFAFARFPLLVHLGARLDDSLDVDVFQRHRASQNWIWPDTSDMEPSFTLRRTEPAVRGEPASDAILIVNATGTIHPSELPSVVADLPLFTIELDGDRHPDSVSSRAVRDTFERTLREMLGQLEADDKVVRRLHVFAAAPVSVGVTLGRAVGWGIHPDLLVYDRLDNHTYAPALEITAP